MSINQAGNEKLEEFTTHIQVKKQEIAYSVKE